jgi:hypothetical protein
VKTASIDTANANRDEHLKGPNCLGVKQFPTIAFKSKRVAKAGDDKYDVEGTLSLHGVDRPVKVQLERTGARRNPMGWPIAGYATTFSIKRSEYGMKAGLEDLSDEVVLVVNLECVALKIPTKIAGTYRGGELVALRVRDRIAFLVKPAGAVDPQKRWLWDFPFWLGINDGFGNLAHRYYIEKALAAGFHVAGVDVGPSCASPAAAEVCQEFYELLVSHYGLHKRARVMGHSHGGLIAYGWAFRHPTCVDRIAGMCPATDFRTYPTLPNVVTGPTKGLDYGLSLEELDRRAGEFNPVENLAPLAKAGAKILHLHGDKDTLVPTGANSTELARRYRELGGEAEIVLLKGLGVGRANSRGHDGPELYESAQLLKFLLAD